MLARPQLIRMRADEFGLQVNHRRNAIELCEQSLKLDEPLLPLPFNLFERCSEVNGAI
jgi:hypothetical protein